MKPIKKDNRKQVNCGEKLIRNMLHYNGLDQSAYLKYFDKITEEWVDDNKTDNPDILVETRSINPRNKNEREK